jgi:plastocyanin
MEEDVKTKEQGREHSIRIEVNGSGDFTYTPALLHVNAGDSINWAYDGADFIVEFKEDSPIDQMTITAALQKSVRTFDVTVLKGNFHYAVAVWDGSRIFIDSGCPRISVN